MSDAQLDQWLNIIQAIITPIFAILGTGLFITLCVMFFSAIYVVVKSDIGGSDG